MQTRLWTLLMTLLLGAGTTAGGEPHGLIDDFGTRESRLGTRWRLVTDQVMGGVSTGRMERRELDGRTELCMTGDVSLANNGGFVQVNLDLGPSERFDAGDYTGVRLVVRGNGEVYNLHLKTAATTMPWQSYRADFVADATWREVRLPFAAFTPHRLVPALDVTRLKRLGIVAIGRAMQAELCVDEVGFYR
jgi:hypothetical protein